VIDDLQIRQQLLDTGEITGELGDRYFAELKRQINIDIAPSPRIVLYGLARDGTLIRVVEGVAVAAANPHEVNGILVDTAGQRPVHRGFIWYAMTGLIDLVPSYLSDDGACVPCRIIGGTRVATSTTSARHALDLAQRALAPTPAGA
jgi:hypothetical protein